VLDLMGLSGDAVTAVSHGTTVATNQLLEGKLDRIGFITTEGYESVLEIARQSVPDGYGNSYFWVKPPRIVPADLVRTVRGRLDHRGAEVRPLDEDDARAAARSSATPGSARSASASCTPTRTTPTSAGCSRCCARSTPTRW
jgi:N-methylhydantoinase A